MQTTPITVQPRPLPTLESVALELAEGIGLDCARLRSGWPLTTAQLEVQFGDLLVASAQQALSDLLAQRSTRSGASA